MYITLAKIRAALPEEITAQLLDDSNSGVPDSGLWAEIVAQVQTEIDGKLGQRFPLPLATPVPAIVETMAFVLTAELLYQRRNFFDDANPWTARAKSERAKLDAIARGDQPLTHAAKPARPSGSIIAERAKTTPSTGHMMC